MPFNPNPTAVAPVQAASSEDRDDFSISPSAFQYAKVTDASGTELLQEDAIYPIIASLGAGRKFTQGIRGGQSVQLAFENDVVLLSGVTTSSGKPDYHWWDARRFEIVEADELTDSELEEALDRF